MKKRIVWVLVVLVAAGAGVYAFRGRNNQPNNRIVVSGNIELTEVNIGFKTAGRLIERNVDEGDAVKKGQIVARLDRDQLAAQRDRETAAMASAESQLAQARTSSKARVTTDYAGKVYNGRVTFISSEAEFTPKHIQTQQERVKLVYRIKIEMDNPRHEFEIEYAGGCGNIARAMMENMIETRDHARDFKEW